ncbi:DUF6879 family protein [Saccharopolyspora phatthalungensis]|uniref:DUF6879 domain-containing protein n=1 Tax=Saccharopolyspora phatthalungensis TaxID=664693 RepID=A0A840QGR5_9PSEU|nr:DUF6879 family protein [Saccharopolyspora phatthalungensis]MBB5159160.1 hypothetical protein [Saccharopolyspora phatthalungensis]
MSRLVRPGPGFDELFSSFGRSAWRFETQPAYHVDAEQQAMRRYLNSGELDVSYLTGWLDGVREATRQGKRYARVRVLTEPLTDYLRFEMAVAPYNIAAGEDIRVLSPAQASELALPDYDYWLFDDEWLAIMHFGPSGLRNAEVVTDPETVEQHRAWRDTAARNGRSFEDHPARGLS